MRFIVKNIHNQPSQLLDHKNQKHYAPNWHNFHFKNLVRAALLKEQGFICCYCMRRIENDPLSTKVEHLKPQWKYDGSIVGYPDLRLDYMNMLACCNGTSQFAGRIIYSCDTYRGNLHKYAQEMDLNPLDKFMMRQIRFTDAGQVYSNNIAYDIELNTKLHLNNTALKSNRADFIIAITQLVQKDLRVGEDQKPLTKAYCQQMIDKYQQRNADNQFKQFCEVAIYWFSQRMSKAE